MAEQAYEIQRLGMENELLRDFVQSQNYSAGHEEVWSALGNPYDNALAEIFFSILKIECIYRHKPATFSEANGMIDRYIHFYYYERIQLKTGEAPLARRRST